MQGLLINLESLNGVAHTFMWPFVRIAAIFSSAPFLGSRLVPMRVRLILAAMITVLILPSIKHQIVIDPFGFQGFMIVINQIVIGVLMGFILQIVFNAVALAGENIAMTMGLGFAQMVDPQNGIQVPVISQIYVIIGTLLFLILNGHITLTYFLIKSFTILPINHISLDVEMIWIMLKWVTIMFSGALMIALPAVVALLIINFSMGVMTKSSPQLNIFSIGFPITILAGFCLILLNLPAYIPVFTDLLEQSFEFIRLTILGGS